MASSGPAWASASHSEPVNLTGPTEENGDIRYVAVLAWAYQQV